ncbi:MAG: hypothetical protein IT518_26690 [Burkholderiales bacterium]|nr:hypothetical protein [Burkholderiales bacterium]
MKRFCRELRQREPEQFDRLEFAVAEESQVDYGEGAPTRHPSSGRYRKPRLFVMTLRYSRRAFRKVGKRFDSIEAQNEYLLHWEENRRVHDQDATTVTSAEPPCAR